MGDTSASMPLRLPDTAPPLPARRRARYCLRPALRKTAITLLALLAIALCGWLGYGLGQQKAMQDLRETSNHRLDLFALAAEGVVHRLENIPPIVQLNPAVLELLRMPDEQQPRAAANLYLEQLNAHLGSMAVFVTNRRGLVVASSNGSQPDDSRRGNDISFRPYFLEALAGRVGRHFALGVEGGEPGYFVAYPIHDGPDVVGVAAIKINLAPINEAWSMLGVPALLADLNQVVMLSSNPDWRYRSLVSLPLERRVDLLLTRLYNERRLQPFPVAIDLSVDQDSQIIEGSLPGSAATPLTSRGTGTLVLGRTLNGMDWRLITFSSLDGVRDAAVLWALTAALTAGSAILALLYLAQRRRILRQRRDSRRQLEQAYADLERKVQDRTQDLTDANRQLVSEIHEREQAEHTLRATQDELVHAAKMALLGQLATSITHELTQPLGAMRTLAANSAEFLRRGDTHTLEGNLAIMGRLSEQMGSIITPLKSFARKSQPHCEPVDAARAVANSLFLYSTRLRQENIEVDNQVLPGHSRPWCDPNRLEQVITNLIGNAIDAMQATPRRELSLLAGTGPSALLAAEGLSVAPSCPWILVRDTGHGLPDDSASLFEPFHTTKASGAGLGLGLTISRDITRAFGGDIQAVNRPGGGACFAIVFPAQPSSSTSPP